MLKDTSFGKNLHSWVRYNELDIIEVGEGKTSARLTWHWSLMHAKVGMTPTFSSKRQMPKESQSAIRTMAWGKKFDPATNLIYFGQRYYDPNLGRWLTQLREPVQPDIPTSYFIRLFFCSRLIG